MNDLKFSVEEFFASDDFVHLKGLTLPRFGKREFVLGLSALTHDTSAAVVDFKTGKTIFAQSEERNSNLKHDSTFPIQSILNCVEAVKKERGTIRSVCLNFDPEAFIQEGIVQNLQVVHGNQNYEKVVTTIKNYVNNQISNNFDSGKIINISFLLEVLQKNCSINLSKDLSRVFTYYIYQFRKYTMLTRVVEKLFPEVDVFHVKHHKSHAATAKYNFSNDASILILDGHGEASSCTLFDQDLNEVSNTFWPVSLGSFYLTSTRYLGFDYGDEYKVMGMSALGQPRFVDLISSFMFFNQDLARLDVLENPYYKTSFIKHTNQLRYEYTEMFEQVIPRRADKSKFEQIHFDFAASVQKITEQIGLNFAKSASQLINCDELHIAGGVGLNGLMNEKIRTSGLFKNVEIYPASGDDGTSVGAAQFIADPKINLNIKTVFFGTSFNVEEIESLLSSYPLSYVKYSNPDAHVANLLASNNIVARYMGRSEFGPRALGNRSILANPLDKKIKDTLNLRIKHREEFRPFAPSILADKVSQYFHFDGESPYMLFIPKAKSELSQVCPGITHVDLTARIQTVDKKENSSFYNLIHEFFKITSMPILVNTSFNLNGEAIVDTPQDAVESFLFMDIDFLVIDNYVINKTHLAPKFKNQFKTHDAFLARRKSRYKSKHPHILKSVDCRLK